MLLRPLLSTTRLSLRCFLTTQNISWIEDPSNLNLESERVRTRHLLNQGSALPDQTEIARLASASMRTRRWINQETAKAISANVRRVKTGLVLERPGSLPRTIMQELFCTLVQVVGGQSFRVPVEKLIPAIKAFENGHSTRHAVGQTIISVKRYQVEFNKEIRPTRGAAGSADPALSTEPTRQPDISTLERFRPACDDAPYLAMNRVMSTPSRST